MENEKELNDIVAEGYKFYTPKKDLSKKRILNFGKYKGQTLQEINEKDQDYLKWLVDKNSFIQNCNKLKKDIRAVIAS